jgi:hypothetical protein
VSITKVVVILTRSLEKLSLKFSKFSTIFWRIDKIQQYDYTIEVTLLRQGP